jgi:phosphohistidine swiveling domain-containing protein
MTFNNKIIRGVGASSGKATGNCRIVQKIQEAHEIKDGDILVMPTLNPEIILHLSKCSAIITDIGGLTSHAAVIAREFGIPCVVGTEIATKILKDDMTVKVDGAKGLVILQESIAEDQETKNDFVIFGNSVTPKQLHIVRKQPLWPKIWNWDWPEITFDMATWVVPRPDIHGSFIQRSLVAAAIECIPYSLGFDDVGPLYVRYYDNLYVHFDKIKSIKETLKTKLLEVDEIFWNNFVNKMKTASEDFDTKTKNLTESFEKHDSMEKLLSAFEEWWKAHNYFFSLTYFVQSMGDDIVSPKIIEMLSSFKDENEIQECLGVLLSPLTDDEIIVSLRFAQETFALLKKGGVSIRKILQNDLDESIIIKNLENTTGGQIWLHQLTNHCKKWGWLRQRDLYYPSLENETEMLGFIRKSLPKKLAIDLNKNNHLFKKLSGQLQQEFSANDYKTFMFYVTVCKFLQRQRDNHHYLWIRNTNIVRMLVLRFGQDFHKEKIIEEKMDVFFLTVPEILNLLRNSTVIEKRQIKEKIDQRIAHLSKVSKTLFHRNVTSVVTPECLNDVF